MSEALWIEFLRATVAATGVAAAVAAWVQSRRNTVLARSAAKNLAHNTSLTRTVAQQTNGNTEGLLTALKAERQRNHELSMSLAKVERHAAFTDAEVQAMENRILARIADHREKGLAATAANKAEVELLRTEAATKAEVAANAERIAGLEAASRQARPAQGGVVLAESLIVTASPSIPS